MTENTTPKTVRIEVGHVQYRRSIIRTLLLGPISILFATLIALLEFISALATGVFFFLMCFALLGAVLAWIKGELDLALGFFVTAFLLSPMGLPALANTLVAFLIRVKYHFDQKMFVKVLPSTKR